MWHTATTLPTMDLKARRQSMPCQNKSKARGHMSLAQGGNQRLSAECCHFGGHRHKSYECLKLSCAFWNIDWQIPIYSYIVVVWSLIRWMAILLSHNHEIANLVTSFWSHTFKSGLLEWVGRQNWIWVKHLLHSVIFYILLVKTQHSISASIQYYCVPLSLTDSITKRSARRG